MVKKICLTENPVEDAQLPCSSWSYPLTEVEVDDGKKDGDGLPDPRLERMKLKMVEDDDTDASSNPDVELEYYKAQDAEKCPDENPEVKPVAKPVGNPVHNDAEKNTQILSDLLQDAIRQGDLPYLPGPPPVPKTMTRQAMPPPDPVPKAMTAQGSFPTGFPDPLPKAMTVQAPFPKWAPPAHACEIPAAKSKSKAQPPLVPQPSFSCSASSSSKPPSLGSSHPSSSSDPMPSSEVDNSNRAGYFNNERIRGPAGKEHEGFYYEMFNSRRDYERCVRNQKRKRGGKKLKKNQQEWSDATDY